MTDVPVQCHSVDIYVVAIHSTDYGSFAVLYVRLVMESFSYIRLCK